MYRWRSGREQLVAATAVLTLLACGSSEFKKAGEYHRAGLFDEAIEQLNIAIADHPDNPGFHFLKAQCYLDSAVEAPGSVAELRGELAKAEESFLRSIRLDPTWRAKVTAELLRAAGELPVTGKSYEAALAVAIRVDEDLAAEIGRWSLQRHLSSEEEFIEIGEAPLLETATSYDPEAAREISQHSYGRLVALLDGGVGWAASDADDVHLIRSFRSRVDFFSKYAARHDDGLRQLCELWNARAERAAAAGQWREALLFATGAGTEHCSERRPSASLFTRIATGAGEKSLDKVANAAVMLALKIDPALAPVDAAETYYLARYHDEAGRGEAARALYQRLVDDFPEAKEVPPARARLDELEKDAEESERRAAAKRKRDEAAGERARKDFYYAHKVGQKDWLKNLLRHHKSSLLLREETLTAGSRVLITIRNNAKWGVSAVTFNNTTMDVARLDCETSEVIHSRTAEEYAKLGWSWSQFLRYDGVGEPWCTSYDVQVHHEDIPIEIVVPKTFQSDYAIEVKRLD